MKKLSRYFAPLALAAFAFALTLAASAQDKETILHQFTNGADGASPVYLIMDAAGDFYGAASAGGNTTNCSRGCGTIFKLSKASGHWEETTLYTFLNGTDGANPSGITMDAAGNIYGFASGSLIEAEGLGSAFKLVHPTGSDWKFELIHDFGAITDDGLNPVGAPIFDAAGNMYAATQFGGSTFDTTACVYGCGAVVELTPTVAGPWKDTVIYSFLGMPDVDIPVGGLIFDPAGNLYGISQDGGAGSEDCGYGCGAVFELSPSASGWTETILHSFTGYPFDGQNPEGGLAMDSSGNIFGTTYNGGNVNTADCFGSCGSVFEISPVSGGGWSEKIILDFNVKTNGALPSEGVTLDSAGNIYGISANGPVDSAGTVYELSKSAGKWTATVLYTLGTNTGDGGSSAGGPVLLDTAGNLYGTTRYEGSLGYGNVFKLSPPAMNK